MNVLEQVNQSVNGIVAKRPKTFNDLKSERTSIRTTRVGSCERGYTYRWRQARKQYLIENPLCVMCAAKGRTEQAVTVDHIIPHKGNKELFWDRKNWQSLCKQHHDSKTASQDGGFGK
jgi:5-methylcytosine-specific restriction protein A